MGCTSSSEEAITAQTKPPPPPTFEEAQAQIHKQMKQKFALNFPLTGQQALEQLRLDQGLQFARDILERSPAGCHSQSIPNKEPVLLQLVHHSLHDPKWSQQDATLIGETLKLLLSKGADVNVMGRMPNTPSQGLTALHLVALASSTQPVISTELLKVLLAQPALDVNIKSSTNDSNTAAHIAALMAQESFLSLLKSLSPTCDLAATNAEGQTVTDALKIGLARRLSEQASAAKKVVLAAARGNSTVDLEAALKFLVSNGFLVFLSDPLDDLEAGEDTGRTLLGVAAARGHYNKTFATLLASGCDPTRRDAFYRTPDFYLHDRPPNYQQQLRDLLLQHSLSRTHTPTHSQGQGQGQGQSSPVLPPPSPLLAKEPRPPAV